MLWNELDTEKRGFFTAESMQKIAERCGLTLAADVMSKMIDLAAAEDEAEIVTKYDLGSQVAWMSDISQG